MGLSRGRASIPCSLGLMKAPSRGRSPPSLCFQPWTGVSCARGVVAHVAFWESIAHAFLGDVKGVCSGSHFHRVVMMAPTRARGGFESVGPGRRMSH
jgi:hypothetical protein